ncbi:hypothetical protein EXE53_20225 [Halorubrum sp. SD626R]|uniref:hypothetical protein n=1 Tax=Halorubrum sp. SD626R TaxID=1419722 RepID=UPI0010F584DA|nr:hypothetical protein [Halorubrum sp. SD626R]TKX78627.1 hypothetical protein EXE53_20225 [Halorubrum sp. SD626R]
MVPPTLAVGPTLAVDTALGWLSALALFAAPGVAAAVLWSPFLLASRFRALFRALPPTGRFASSYLAVALGLSVPYLAGVLLTAGLVDSAGAGWSNALVETAIVGGLCTGVVAPVVAVVGLPRLGIDWDPTGYGPSTWALVVAAGLWYAAVAAVPLFALAVVFALPGGY